MFKIIVCDDERFMADSLSENISDFFDHLHINIELSRYFSGKALLDSGEYPDVLFLDVRMKNPDGFETARELRRRGFSGFLIFVTILKEEVFRSFEVQAFDYLVKPLQPEDFFRTMNRLTKTLQDIQGNRLLISKGREWIIVPFADILYCEVVDRKIYIHLRNGDILDYYEKMKNLIEKLDNRFFQCHRSYLINLQYLKSYQEGEAKLIGGEIVPVSRLRGEAFSAVLLHYMKTKGQEQ